MKKLCISLVLTFFIHSTVAQTDKGRLRNSTFHFMNTVVQQGHSSFSPLYSGIKSLDSNKETQITVRNTWFLGRRLGKNTSIYINPELAGGSGLSGVSGFGGFPNGEAFRVGSGAPKVYVARFFIRHQILLNEEVEQFQNSVNQFEEELTTKRITLTAGKFSLLDYFDGSQYANDGRTQFMNWALMTGGAYDFASDTRGNTWGVLAEYFVPGRIMRFAAVVPSNTPNGPKFDFNFPHASGYNFDIRQNFKLFHNPATVGFTAFLNHTLGAKFNDITNTAPDSVRTFETRYRKKYGFITNLEQEFQRWAWFVTGSWADGKTENWGFTQIDHSLMGGFVLFGYSWLRPNDKLGIGGAINGLSPEQRNFLARGGNGFIIGDGRLTYAPEKVFEVYYSIRANLNIYITLDYQYIWDMAYNSDRGNIGVWGIRSHVEF